ncbi:DUF1109 domain-containing protein [Achromobacter aloeverae]
MKTDDLISLLANNVAPVDKHAAARRYGVGLLLGALGAIVLTLAVFGMRPDIGVMLHTPLFWAKVAFPALTAAAALRTLLRLSRPGTPVGNAWALTALPLLVLWIAAAAAYGLAPAGERMPMLLGTSWRSCPFAIALLSIPALAGAFWAVKGMAPVRPRGAGAAAGLVAGSIATTAYCLHCPEMGVAFWAVWYVAGMLVPVVIGALLGPRLLRW